MTLCYRRAPASRHWPLQFFLHAARPRSVRRSKQLWTRSSFGKDSPATRMHGCVRRPHTSRPARCARWSSRPWMNSTARSSTACRAAFPFRERPFRDAARTLGTTEQVLLERIGRLLADRTLTRFGPLFHVERMGGRFDARGDGGSRGRLRAVAGNRQCVSGSRPQLRAAIMRSTCGSCWRPNRPRATEQALAHIEAATGPSGARASQGARVFRRHEPRRRRGAGRRRRCSAGETRRACRRRTPGRSRDRQEPPGGIAACAAAVRRRR